MRQDSSDSVMGCGSSSVPAISESSQEAVSAGGRRKSYNTGGNIFPKSARNKERMSSLDEEDENVNVSFNIKFSTECDFLLDIPGIPGGEWTPVRGTIEMRVVIALVFIYNES